MAKTPMKKATPGAGGDALSKVNKGEGSNNAATRPKGAKNAYMFWLLENREKISALVGKKKALKECGKRWKDLHDKSKWEKLAAEDKERFQREKAQA
ncbi:HMG-box domain-containing protein [Ditylenchus destructor]|uniref:HMG-box domain-containing protein n=1 Tax=Ditylenchus destructor TaxID=166010 RepID=A0AAD4NCN0_9BILA|nr:HMG-box domain-containing protein [Ditylenchus destructor]